MEVEGCIEGLKLDIGWIIGSFCSIKKARLVRYGVGTEARLTGALISSRAELWLGRRAIASILCSKRCFGNETGHVRSVV